MRDLLEIIKGRRSIRKFKPDPIPEEDLREILEAGIWAPSAGNTQEWRFYVVRDPALKAGLASAALEQRFLAEAPVVIVVCADLEKIKKAYGERGVNVYALQDTAAAAQNMLLMAHAKGLGSCWVGAFSEVQVREVLGLGAMMRPLVLIPLGYPAQSPSPRPRCPLEEVVEYR